MPNVVVNRDPRKRRPWPADRVGHNISGPHACGYCPMSFTTKQNRQAHVNGRHAPLLPHQCPFCLRRFEVLRGVHTHCGREHPECYVRRRQHDAARWAWNLKRYGLTPEEYDAILAAQGSGCAGCGATQADGSARRLHVDHNHASGRVRGLLCSNCNTALGKLQDDPALLRRLADYLEGA